MIIKTLGLILLFATVVDNKMLAQEKRMSFAGFDWHVKSGDEPLDPGGNYFSNSLHNVKINRHKYLELAIDRRDKKYYSVEIYSDSLFSFGRFVYVVKTPIGKVLDNSVLGMFLYNHYVPPYYNEVDIEFSRWGISNFANSQYVVYTDAEKLPRHRFESKMRVPTTHVVDYYSDSVVFRSFVGEPKTITEFITPYNKWSYLRKVPSETNELVRVHFNYWIVKNLKPNSRNGKFEIKYFSYTPF